MSYALFIGLLLLVIPIALLQNGFCSQLYGEGAASALKKWTREHGLHLRAYRQKKITESSPFLVRHHSECIFRVTMFDPTTNQHQKGWARCGGMGNPFFPARVDIIWDQFNP